VPVGTLEKWRWNINRKKEERLPVRRTRRERYLIYNEEKVTDYC
jgi:hypothetical protein